MRKTIVNQEDSKKSLLKIPGISNLSVFSFIYLFSVITAEMKLGIAVPLANLHIIAVRTIRKKTGNHIVEYAVIEMKKKSNK